ncbi:TPA: hypothetical protein ACQVKY_005150 [Serratia marcescens]|uniref:Uncharacterized protein n=1 Tax=Serratia nevei TaxID=2703794 RepID=A0ABT7G5K6_9GAMM|nr:hypothetical protein [Serratia nevei]HAU4290871.1 hypothetical protein [Serratia marcescens]MDK5169043.1 hypothetical protein [Serratia nevei]MDK5298537.1 hypothetical protein [Serratia nevei]MEC5887211.1 hypothetical protein [Serratia nevei]HAU4297475.1 hypothetical protein [Serratia marcescens]
MKIDKEIIALAIEELKAKNEKVNLSGVMRITGYYHSDLVAAGYGYLARTYTKTPKATTYRPATPVEKIHLEHSIESYTGHVQDNYFAHPETLNEVEQSIAAEVHGFQTEIYRQAINLLILSKQLQPLQNKPDHYSGHFPVDDYTAGHEEPLAPAQEPPEQPQAVYLVRGPDGSIAECYGLDAANETAKAVALKHPEQAVQIFSLVHTAKATLSITFQ